MDQEYDVVVCGTGFKECILSGLLSTHGERVLHVDRHNYYGGESASLNLTNLFEKFNEQQNVPRGWGENRDWNVDLIPKFIMSDGQLVRILLKTGVKDYLEFQVVEGCYVYQHQKSGWLSNERFIHKVPATETEAFGSSLIPMMEKLRGKTFFAFIARYREEDVKTWPEGMNPLQHTMADCYNHFGVSESIQEFVGHAIALHTSDDYLREPMHATLRKLQLYMLSLLRYGHSPFIYPMYGLGTLPEGFSRLSAVYGGTYMLDTPVKRFLYDDAGKVCGVEGVDGQVARCRKVICDPTYCLEQKLTEKIRVIGQCVRVINILNAPIPGTNDKRSCQIILPQKQLQRKSDVYIAMISSSHGICKDGKYVALVSAMIETADPMEELRPAFKVLGEKAIEKQFVNIQPVYEPVDDGHGDNIFVTSSYDATSHFETATEDVLRMWKSITGKDLDLTTPPAQRTEE